MPIFKTKLLNGTMNIGTVRAEYRQLPKKEKSNIRESFEAKIWGDGKPRKNRSCQYILVGTKQPTREEWIWIEEIIVPIINFYKQRQ